MTNGARASGVRADPSRQRTCPPGRRSGRTVSKRTGGGRLRRPTHWNTGEYSYLPDTLQGGDGDDILIGGYTLYDLDPDQLTALRDYWAGADDYATRVANLTTGTGVPLLDASTVFSNYAGNTLLGEADVDLFFGIQDLDQHDWDELQGESFVGPLG